MAEPTGFEPAIFGVTVQCVKPGYTTVPRAFMVKSNRQVEVTVDFPSTVL